MIKKQWFRIFSVFVILVFLGACGNKEETVEKPEDHEVQGEQDGVEEEEVQEEDTEREEPHNVIDVTSTENWNPALEEKTGGTVEVLYSNSERGYVNDLGGLIVTVEGYQIVRVTDMNQGQGLFFEDLEGYFVTAKATTENTTDKDLYYNNIIRIQLADAYDYIQSDSKFYVPEEWYIWRDSERVSFIKAGEKIEYLVTFNFTNEEFDRMQSVEPKFVIEGRASENEDYSDGFGEDAIFDFVYSEEHAEAVASAPDFYPDRLTTIIGSRKR